MPIRTLLDTDIGTDVDDCLALAVLLGSTEIALEAVTCVYGDVQLRGRMVRTLLTLAGRPEIPVALGAASPLLGLRPVYWAGHEGEGLLDRPYGAPTDELPAPHPDHAVDLIVRTVMDNPGQIHLLAIGPLTNVALALKREPGMADQLRHLTIMGGAVRSPDRLDLRYVEHNLACDPEAAHIVLTAGAPVTLVPLDVTTRVRIRPADVAALRAAGDRFHDAVADQVERYPRFAETGATFLHDPLAAAVVLRPDLVELIPARIDVETHGRLTAGMTLLSQLEGDDKAPAQVAITVDVPAAERFIRERLIGPVIPAADGE